MNLSLCDRHNAIINYSDWLTKYCMLIPCFVREGAQSVSSVAKLFFNNLERFFSVSAEVISNRDSRFAASFW